MVAEGEGEDTVVVEQAQMEVMVQEVRVLLCCIILFYFVLIYLFYFVLLSGLLIWSIHDLLSDGSPSC